MAKFDLVKLQEKVEDMSKGEGKRRDIALEYANAVTGILLEVAPDIWGDGNFCEFPNTVFLTRIMKDGTKRNTNIYFRYEEHAGDNDVEIPGFYYQTKYHQDYPVWGKLLEDLRGNDFWYAIQVIIEWIPQVIKLIDKKSKGREDLLELIKIEK